MSDLPEIDAAGLPEELSAVDQLLHRGEANPRTRSGIMGVELLDATPDWERFRARFENASRKVLRLRQKVVMPTLPTAAPRWVVDPDFNLDFHVRRVRVPAPGTLREVMDLAEVALQSPMDISRPLWTATLVEGLADGKAATMLHLSHAVTDGVGAIEMFANIYDLERDPPPAKVAPLPIPEDLSPNDLMRRGLQQAARLDRGRHPRRHRGSGVRVRAGRARPGLRRRRRRQLRQVGRAGDGSGGRAVAAAAQAQPVVAHRGDRHQVQRPAQGVEGGGRLDQRRLPRRPVRGASALPRSQGHPRRDAADGGPGQPAVGRRSRGRKPIRRSQSRGAGRGRRPGEAHPEGARADDAQARGARDRHGRRHGAADQPAARRASSSRWPARWSTPTCRPATCRSIRATHSSRARRYCGTTGLGRCPASR